MGLFLTLAFLFFIGSVIGWVLELFFRRFFSKSTNPEHKWINPGFCTGPYLPLYGIGLCVLFLIASLENTTWIENPFWEKIALFVFMALCMTAIEYVVGVVSIKVAHVRLWDYSNVWGNVQGIICPLFSFFWAILGAVYYFLIHPHILGALNWLAHNLAFSFFIGMFYGIFIIDLAHSLQLMAKLKKFADENNVIIKYENLKARIRAAQSAAHEKAHFFLTSLSEKSSSEQLRDRLQQFRAESREDRSSVFVARKRRKKN